jgi:uncharacterized protein
MTDAPKPGGAPEPSMDDILASIRRILNDGDAPDGQAKAAPAAEPAPAEHAPSQADVFVLEPSMMIEEPEAGPAAPDPAPAHAHPAPAPAAFPAPANEEALVAPQTHAAAGAAMAPLLRVLQERGTRVHAGGPTLEELVRSELRPLLSSWLDQHLPAIVEKAVRAEIQRLSGS